jgi:hypothetical protein
MERSSSSKNSIEIEEFDEAIRYFEENLPD